MRPSVPALPPTLQRALPPFRFLFHADTWPVFLCVLTGLLTGHTTLACVRASLLATDVKWPRLWPSGGIADRLVHAFPQRAGD